MQQKVKITLLIATYNWHKALNLTLLSALNQSLLPSEIVIADDGSTNETKELIEQIQRETTIPILHIWHQDEGFRLTVIRNKAIANSSGDYIIQIDGDLILHRDFIKDHIRFAIPNTFVTGSRALITEERSAKLIESRSIKLSFLSCGVKNRLNGLSIPLFSNVMRGRRVNDIYYMRGCNMAFWREDLLKVNGYNQDMIGWGREDNEIAVRLINSGITKYSLKFGAAAFHLYHNERSRSKLNINDEILAKSISDGLKRCPNGIV